ncbi:MAG: hypothetical protein AAFZ14_03060 [Pseudomonadota bacterium]
MVRGFGLVFCVALSGCAVLERLQGPQTDDASTEVVEDTGLDAPVRPQARPDVAPVADAPVVSVGTLGRTVASLGNAAEPGLWMKTPLVQSERSGIVYYPETNRSVQVTLIPIDGPATAGSRLSLEAMQALGAPLTGLPEVDVLSG